MGTTSISIRNTNKTILVCDLQIPGSTLLIEGRRGGRKFLMQRGLKNLLRLAVLARKLSNIKNIALKNIHDLSNIQYYTTK
jgi:hypothetical protein